jgi:hypothetical protein
MFLQIKMHALVGRRSSAQSHSQMMQEAIEHHHQRFDGTAIPTARGEEIPVGAHYCPDCRLPTWSPGNPSPPPERPSGRSTTREDEWNPLRRNAGAIAASWTQVGRMSSVAGD